MVLSNRFASADVGIERERALELRPGGGGVLQRQIGFCERDPSGRRVLAPQGDLQGVSRVLRSAGPKMDAPDQQVRLGLVRKKVHRPAKFRHGLPILLLLEQPAAAIQVEGGKVALLPLGRIDNGLIQSQVARILELGAKALETGGIGLSVAAGVFSYSADSCRASSRSRAASTPLPLACSAAAST